MNTEELTFLALLRIGLWGKAEDIPKLSAHQWNVISKISEEQTVTGIVTDGIETTLKYQKTEGKDLVIDRTALLGMVSLCLKIEERNKLINETVAIISKKFAESETPTILLKGQMIAQEYPNPLHRNPGDIDLYIDQSKIETACSIVKSWNVSNIQDWHRDFSFRFNSVDIELHWSPVNPREGRLESNLHSWCCKELSKSMCYLELNGSKTDTFVPTLEFNLIYIFYHFFHHFILQGVGLRQICDWMMLLHNHIEEIDKERLKKDLENFKLVKGWIAFEQFAARFLGLPKECCLISDGIIYNDSKSNQILDNILLVGNFGHKVRKPSKIEGKLWERVNSVINDVRQGYYTLRIFPSYLYRFFPNIFEGIFRQIQGK